MIFFDYYIFRQFIQFSIEFLLNSDIHPPTS